MGVDTQFLVRHHQLDTSRQVQKTASLCLTPVEDTARRLTGLLLPTAGPGKCDASTEQACD
jgi:hypothetical protein